MQGPNIANPYDDLYDYQKEESDEIRFSGDPDAADEYDLFTSGWNAAASEDWYGEDDEDD